MAINVSKIYGRDITIQQIGYQNVEPAPKTTIPCELPVRPEHFTGREEELKRISDELLPGHVVTLCGPGGIGKTAIAAEALWRLRDNNALLERFPDGVLYYSFYEQPQVTAAL